jgi:hypothetical protein
MATARNALRDRRAASRLKVDLKCRFTFNGVEHEGLIKDISLMSAFARSSFVPPPAAEISLKIATSLLKTPLVLEGTIVRRDCNNAVPGGMGAFAVKFKYAAHPTLVFLLKKLANSHIPELSTDAEL